MHRLSWRLSVRVDNYNLIIKQRTFIERKQYVSQLRLPELDRVADTEK